jgi:hypothetical protein
MKNEDYLWDKTGSDPEIESLENTLAVFRCQEKAPPELPAKVLPFVKKDSPRTFFRFAYAAAACLALVAVALGLWLRISVPKQEPAADLAEIASPRPENASPPAEIPAPAVVLPATVTAEPGDGTPRPSFKLRAVRIKKPVAEARVTREIKVKNTIVALSKEEKYAYDQLMLALSITGSKLKLVSDRIDGNPVNRDGR